MDTPHLPKETAKLRFLFDCATSERILVPVSGLHDCSLRVCVCLSVCVPECVCASECVGMRGCASFMLCSVAAYKAVRDAMYYLVRMNPDKTSSEIGTDANFHIMSAIAARLHPLYLGRFPVPTAETTATAGSTTPSAVKRSASTGSGGGASTDNKIRRNSSKQTSPGAASTTPVDTNSADESEDD